MSTPRSGETLMVVASFIAVPIRFSAEYAKDTQSARSLHGTLCGLRDSSASFALEILSFKARRHARPLDGVQPIVEHALRGLDQNVIDPRLAVSGNPRAERCVVPSVPAAAQRDH